MSSILERKLIVGLGNPGKDYRYTRHNLGFLALQYLSDKLKLKVKPCSFTKAMVAEVTNDKMNAFFLFPLTFMNNSGVAVKAASEKYGLSLKDILIVCDDSSLDLGQIRLRNKGSDGGHNGLASVIYNLSSHNFPRLRIGIGAPKPGYDLAEYVLSEFAKEETEQLEEIIQEAAQCCGLWLKGETNQAMEKYNRRKENGKK
ncbi:MAG: aminoacyl-tRNA hydrolase [Candidatus Omnitrophica bacterium]|nr:aminoacyl-tRNA hydrolase [Candidatus Omnitrophota bacterium]